LCVEEVETNLKLIKAGVTFSSIQQNAYPIPPEFREQSYVCVIHGVGMCDEFPIIYYPEDYIEGAFDYALEAGMVLCVEAYCGEVGGSAGVKLENSSSVFCLLVNLHRSIAFIFV